jgi:flagellar motor switch protein FliN/FliY
MVTASNSGSPEDFGLGADFDNALAQVTGEAEAQASGAPPPAAAAEASPAPDMGALAGASAGGGSGMMRTSEINKLKMILDVPMKVHVELGRTKMLINDLLQLGQGSVIELDKLAGEPMEILINDKLVALGEVVVVNEKFGVRLTDVISQFGLGDFAQK